MRPPRWLAGLLLAPLLAGLGAACGSSGPITWRGMTVERPEGWVVDENSPGALTLANAPLASPGDPGDREAAVYFMHQRGATPGDWRGLVAERPTARIEEEDSLTLDGIPATLLVISDTSDGTPRQEMVVIIPARDVVILLQPVVVAGSDRAPALFAAHRATFEALLASIDFGPPPDSLPAGRHPLAGSVVL